MKLRRFSLAAALPALALLALALLALSGLQATAQNLLIAAEKPANGSERPNIVIFITDDQNQSDLGCYGNKDVQTPNMDRLAAEGMRFTSAYAASSMCTPSRSSLFTGLYPFRNGCQMNHFAVRAGVKSLPHYLKPLGYRVVLAGKTHVTPRAAFPFEYIGQEFGRYEPIETRSDPRKETVQFIQDHFRGQPQQPLCLVVAPWLPHVPWVKNRDFDPANLALPEYLADTKKTRAALAAYYQSIGEADRMLGEIMAALESTGEQSNTVFLFFSDQGTQFPGAKWTVYDRGLRVPLIARWPDKIREGSISDALVSLTDITPTVLELAGGKPAKDLDGKSFAPVLLGKKEEHREYIFAETSVEPHYWYNYTPARTVISREGFHYIRNYHPGRRFITHIDEVEQNMYYFDSWVKKAREDEKAAFLLRRYSYRPSIELYDLDKDPEELQNLAENPRYATRLAQLGALLGNELASQGETEEMIREGHFPRFQANSYELPQGEAAFHLSFDKNRWNPDTLNISGYLQGDERGKDAGSAGSGRPAASQPEANSRNPGGRQAGPAKSGGNARSHAPGGVICRYFRQFTLLAENGKLALAFDGGKTFYSRPLKQISGHFVLRLGPDGEFALTFNGNKILEGGTGAAHTVINGGYVSCGFLRDAPVADPFQGQIHDLRFTMNRL